VLRDLAVRLRALGRRQREVRVAEDRDSLPAHGGGRERRLRPRGLADVDDPRPRRRGLDGGSEGLGPQTVHHESGAFASRRLSEPLGEVLALDRHRLVGAQLAGALETLRVPPGRDDVRSSEQAGCLHRDRPERARRSEHEHEVVLLDGRHARERQPG
jgi:hypothetical protein